MDLKELANKLEEIKSNGDLSALNILMDETEKDEAAIEMFLAAIENNPPLIYYILINRFKKSDFLRRVRKLFENTKWYKKIYKNLYYPEAHVRRYFIRELGRARSGIFLKLMVEKLKDNDFDVRKEIMMTLSRQNTDKSMSILISMLDDTDGRLTKEVISILSDKGVEILPHLNKYTSSPSGRIKLNIIEILRRIGLLDVVPVLLNLTEDRNDEVRIAAQQYLIALAEKSTLTNNAEDSAVILGFLEKQLQEDDDTATPILIKILIKFKKAGAKIIVKKLENGDKVKSQIFTLFKDVRLLDKIYTILEMMNSTDIQIKAKGFEYLQKFDFDDKYSEAVALIIEDFVDSNLENLETEEKEIIAAFVIKQKLLERIVIKLKDPDPETRTAAVYFVGIIADSKISQIIITLSKDPDKGVRVAVVKTLGMQKDESLLPKLREMLDDPEEDVQLACIEAIAKLKSPKAKEIIFKLIDNPNKKIKELASKIIAKESLKKYIDSFDKLNAKSKERVAKLMELLEGETEKILAKEIKSIDPEERKRVIEILFHINNKSKFKKILEHAIKDPEKTIRAMVVNLLVHLEDKDMLIELLKLLNDPDKRVRANAIEALGNVSSGNQETVSKLLSPFLKDPNNRIRANAIMALYDLGNKEVINSTVEMLHDRSEFMRASAVFCIGKVKAKEKAEYLYTFKSDPSVLVRKNLVKTFNKLGKKEYIVHFFNDSISEIRELAKASYQSKEGDE